MPTRIEWTDEYITRFWSNVDTSGDCWLWVAGKFTSGYGQFRVGKKKVRAHRAAWELVHGLIPDGLRVCHKCDNPLCVKPSHLFLGTDAVNAADRHRKGRSAQGLRHGAYTKPEKTRHYGEDNGSAKLSAWDVIWIRKLRDTGCTYRQLASTFHVSRSQIGNIIRRDSWRHLCIQK